MKPPFAPRRRLLLQAATAALFVPSLSACVGEALGSPIQVAWGNERCTRCNMVIHDRHFAAVLQDASGQISKFDDIGCAIFWMEKQHLAPDTPGQSLWVADYRRGGWLDARSAHFVAGQRSPMGYQFGASPDDEANSLAFAAMREAVLARGR